MTRIPIHTLESLPEEARPTAERAAARMGRLMNFHGAMANSPLLIDLYETMEEMLATRSSLGEPIRQAIHLTVAATNACAYCMAAYTRAAIRNGFTEDETLEIRRGFVSERSDLTALLRLARMCARQRGHVDEETWQRARDADWSDAQILEAYGEVVRTIFSNYFNHLVDCEVDLPLAPPPA